MCPIILSGSEKGYYGLDEFRGAFQSICRSHRAEGRALAFAFILYDFEHPEIRKVLADSAYWDALDRISGKYLTVFSFHLPPRKPERTHNGVRASVQSPFSDANRFVERTFKVKLPESRPLLLFFQVHDDKVSEPYFYVLKGGFIEDVFHEIRDALVDAVDSLQYVRPEFRDNTEGTFNLIKNSLMQRKLVRNVTGVVKKALLFKEIFS
jgi:hypothetical protein